MISCASIPQVQSSRPSKTITIDGLKNDWDDKSFYIEDANLSLMISNDDQYLYIYASTAEKMPLLARGVTIWFDSTAGKDKYFGLHFPLGMEGNFHPAMMKKSAELNSADERGKDLGPFNDPIAEMDKFEILGENKKDKRTFFLKDKSPIKVALKDNQFYIAYEARIPLYILDSFNYAIKPGAKKEISLGFEFGELEKSSSNRRGSGMMPPGEGGTMPPGEGGGMTPGEGGGDMMPPNSGGMGGPGGGRGGRSGNRGGRGGAHSGTARPDVAEMDDFWIKVILK